MKKRILATVLAAVMALSLLPMSALAAPRYEEEVVAETPMGEEVQESAQREESAAPAAPAEIEEPPAAAELLAEGETGYAGADLPAGPDMSGTTVTVTPANAQYTLDGAYGSIDGKTIVFGSGEYPVLELGRATKYAGSGTLYYNMHWNGSSWVKDDNNPVPLEELNEQIVKTYHRPMTNVTFKMEDGAHLSGFTATDWFQGGNPGPWDYVRDVQTNNNNPCYYFTRAFDGITFDGLTINGQISFWSGMAGTTQKNITIKNCKFVGDESKMANNTYPAIRLNSESGTSGYENLNVLDNKVENFFQGMHCQNPNGATVSGNTITNTTHNAIALQGNVNGTVEVSGNTISGAKDRAIRFGNIGAGAEITVSGNTAANSGDDAGEIMKAGTIAPTASITIAENNDWGEGKKVDAGMLPAAEVDGKGYTSLQAAIDAAKNGENKTVKLLKDTTVELTSSTTWENVTIEGVAKADNKMPTLTVKGDNKLTLKNVGMRCNVETVGSASVYFDKGSWFDGTVSVPESETKSVRANFTNAKFSQAAMGSIGEAGNVKNNYATSSAAVWLITAAPAGQTESWFSPGSKAVIEVGDKKYNADALQMAIDGAESGTITLQDNLSATDAVIPAGKTVTIDLNKKGWSATSEDTSALVNNGTVTIKSTSNTDGLGPKYRTEKTVPVINNGTMTIEGGLFKSAGDNGSLTNNGTLEIKGGCFAVIPTGGTITLAENKEWVKSNSGFSLVDVGSAEAAITKDGETTKYVTLSAAINAAKAGDTVTLLKDVTAASSVTISKDLTLDLNGTTYTSKVKNNAFKINNSTNQVTFTIKDSQGTGCLKDDSGDYFGSAIGFYNNASNQGGTIIVDKTATIKGQIDLTSKAQNMTAEIYGTVDVRGIIGAYQGKGYNPAAIMGNGSADRVATNITVHEGAKVYSDATAIYHPQKGTLNIEGYVEGSASGIAFKSGTLNVKSGATVSCVGEYAAPTAPNGSGAEASGAAIQIEANSGYAGDIKVTVEDGATVKSTNGNAIYQYSNTAEAAASKLTSVTITGGTFTSGEGIAAVAVDETAKSAKKVTVFGGTFSTDVSDYCADGLAATEGENGEYTIGAKAGMVAQVVGGGAYETLAEAITAATAGQTVKLLTDIQAQLPNNFGYAYEAAISIEKDLVLDGGNHKITIDTANWQKFNDKPTGYVFNVGVQDGHKNAVESTTVNVTIKDLTIEGNAEYVRAGINAYAMRTPTEDTGVTNLTLENVDITGFGTFSLGVNNSTVSVKDCDLANGGWQQAISVDKGTTNLTVESGNIGNIAFGGSGTKNNASITGGTIAGVFVEEGSNDKQNIAISGGTFSMDVSAYCAEGFQATKNGDTWSVAVIPTPAPTPSVTYYTLTIHYVDGEGNEVAPSVTRRLSRSSRYNVASPAVEGMVPDQETVSGVMGREDLTVTVTYAANEQLVDPDVPLASGVFIDVAANDWFAAAVSSVYTKELMVGVTANTFAPKALTTRSMVATILHRMESEPTAAAADFSDVLDGAWYAPAVNWANETGLMIGAGNGAFGAEDHITREQLALTFYRYAQFKGQDVTTKGDLSAFADGAETSDWAKEAMTWAVESGLFQGKGQNILDPKADLTRAELAAILDRFFAEEK